MAHATVDTVQDFKGQFARQVDHQLQVPLSAQENYTRLVQSALAEASIKPLTPQIFLIVDRSRFAQTAFLLLLTQTDDWQWIGATEVSTGKPGTFNHFITPLGVFLHSPKNPDYRAAGTYNKNHIRGYGVKGMRVYDFGWQVAQRGWGKGGVSQMRLAMHSTDPQRLEARLGTTASEGCIRIPNSLNHFLDHYGVIDDEYAQAHRKVKNQRVLLSDRKPLDWPGRYLLVIDSQMQSRPQWLNSLERKPKK